MKIRLPLAAALLLALSACATPSATENRIQVVASTNVYGSIAAAIGGDLVAITSIIDNPSQDPHSFEASAQHQLAISRADVVMENGGGYDQFIQTLLEGSGTDAVVLTATTFGEISHEGGANEHVWYDLHTMGELALELAHVLGDLDPGNAGTFDANYESFAQELAGLESQLAAIQAGGAGVVVTELVPLFLLEDAGLENHTPPGFTEAIEEGSDVPPRALDDTLDLLADGDIVIVAYNEQTASRETERVKDAAEEAGIAVAHFTETLPEGTDYLTWMAGNIEVVLDAVNK
jgi:zinc/manganese transport system substrate-binding protein